MIVCLLVVDGGEAVLVMVMRMEVRGWGMLLEGDGRVVGRKEAQGERACPATDYYIVDYYFGPHSARALTKMADWRQMMINDIYRGSQPKKEIKIRNKNKKK